MFLCRAIVIYPKCCYFNQVKCLLFLCCFAPTNRFCTCKTVFLCVLHMQNIGLQPLLVPIDFPAILIELYGMKGNCPILPELHTHSVLICLPITPPPPIAKWAPQPQHSRVFVNLHRNVKLEL